jgi:hypothetical protein
MFGKRFDKFSEAEQTLIASALGIAISYWQIDAAAAPVLAESFGKFTGEAQKLREELGY